MNVKKILLSLTLFLVSLSAIAANTAVLTWAAPTVYADGTPVTAPLTYNLYQALQGQPKLKTASGVTGLTTTVSSGLLSLRTYCWQVSASDGAVEGALSNEACKTFPASPPSAPATLTVQ